MYILTGINSSKQCGEYYFRGIMYTQVSASKHDKKKSLGQLNKLTATRIPRAFPGPV